MNDPELSNPEEVSIFIDRDRQDLETLMVDLINQNAWSTWSRIVLFALLVIFPASLAIAGLTGESASWFLILLTAGFAAGTGYWFWQNRTPKVTAKRAMNNPKNKSMLSDLMQPAELTFSRAGVAMKSRTIETKHSWDAILGIGKTAHHLLLMTSASTFIDLPRNKLSPLMLDQLLEY